MVFSAQSRNLCQASFSVDTLLTLPWEQEHAKFMCFSQCDQLSLKMYFCLDNNNNNHNKQNKTFLPGDAELDWRHIRFPLELVWVSLTLFLASLAAFSHQEVNGDFMMLFPSRYTPWPTPGDRSPWKPNPEGTFWRGSLSRKVCRYWKKGVRRSCSWIVWWKNEHTCSEEMCRKAHLVQTNKQNNRTL